MKYVCQHFKNINTFYQHKIFLYMYKSFNALTISTICKYSSKHKYTYKNILRVHRK